MEYDIENKNSVIEEKNEVVTELNEEAQLKLEVIQTLLEPCDRATYGKKLKQVAEKLGKSKRTVQRLVKKLDICLMKQARRRIQRGGYLQFEKLMYRG